MDLSAYLTKSKTTYEAFAKTVGASSFAVGKWARGQRMPRAMMLSRIREATGGAVTADDFLPRPASSDGRA